MLTWKRSKLDQYGFDRSDFERTRERLEDAWGTEPPETDVLWALWNEALQRHRDWPVQQIIYHQMARFRSHEGEDPTPMLYQSRKAELHGYREQHLRIVGEEPTVEIQASGNGCESCQRLDGTKLPAREALKTMPLPNPDCTHGLHKGSPPFCRCGYGVHFED